MKRARFLQVAAAQALTTRHPLDADLAAAISIAGAARPLEGRAVVQAREGDLASALDAVRFPRAVRSVAQAHPEATLEALRRVESVPATGVLLAPLLNWTSYVVSVLCCLTIVALMLLSYVEPTFRKMAADMALTLPGGGSRHAPMLSLAGLIGLGAALAVLWYRTRRFIGGAQAFAAASALAARGVSASALGELAPAFAPLAAGADERDFVRLSEACVRRAEAEVHRAMALLRFAGIVLCTVPAVLLLTDAYGWIRMLGGIAP